MRLTLLVGLVALALWLVLAFGVQIPSGWVHVPLGLAVAAFARAIVLAEPGAGPEQS